MKTLLTFGLILSIIFSTFPSYAQQQRELTQEDDDKKPQKRTALVIGNADYTVARKLANPSNDATDMANSLSAVGFEVVSGTNLNLKQMNDKVREFGDKLKANGGVGLFYYAGHGIQVSGRNYLIPVDAAIPREDEVDFNALNLDLVLRKMATANNGLNIVILDACRNNPFARSWSRGDDEGGLAQISAPTGTFIAYATSPDRTASDGNGRNGLYTAELLKVIKQPNMKIEDAFKKVTIAVDRTSGGKQVPWTSSSLRGEFYFKADANPSKNPLPTNNSNVATKNGEEIFWREIENSTDTGDFESYLARTGRGEFNGIYKATAELKMFRLKKAASLVAWERLKERAKGFLTYYNVFKFKEELAMVSFQDNSYLMFGFIDRSGKEIITPKRNLVGDFSEGLARFTFGLKWGFIDKTGKVVIAGDYAELGDFREGLAFASLSVGGKMGFIDRTGKEVIPFKYDNVGSFSEGLAVVLIGDEKTGRKVFIDRTGKEVLTLNYDYIGDLSEGLSAVNINKNNSEKWGYIDRTGKEVIPIKYDLAGDFSDGLANVTINNKSGYIDKTGKEVIPIKYDSSRGFSEGLAVVSINKRFGYIDKKGSEIVPIEYDNVWCEAFIKEGFFGVILNGKKGFVDIYGNEYFDF